MRLNRSVVSFMGDAALSLRLLYRKEAGKSAVTIALAESQSRPSQGRAREMLSR